MNKIQMGIGIAVLLVLVGAVPQTYIPERLNPVVTAKGRFEGKPIRLAGPKGQHGEASARIWIKMDQGMCRGSLRANTKATGIFNIGEGHCLAWIPTGGALILDPGGNAGEYEVIIGPEWHPFGPKTRHFMFVPMGLCFILASAFAGELRPHASRLGGKRLLFLVSLAAFSGIVVYPVSHEGGHMVFGMLLGAKPDWMGTVWTCLGGQEPHASFTYLPPGAAPWMSAGGHILPTIVALLLLLVWRSVCRNASWYLSATLVLVPVLMLFSSVGCLFEVFHQSHMDALAAALGLSSPGRVFFSLSPLLVAIAAYLWLGMKLKRGLHAQETLNS